MNVKNKQQNYSKKHSMLAVWCSHSRCWRLQPWCWCYQCQYRLPHIPFPYKFCISHGLKILCADYKSKSRVHNAHLMAVQPFQTFVFFKTVKYKGTSRYQLINTSSNVQSLVSQSPINFLATINFTLIKNMYSIDFHIISTTITQNITTCYVHTMLC